MLNVISYYWSVDVLYMMRGVEPGRERRGTRREEAEGEARREQKQAMSRGARAKQSRAERSES